ncbi:hypothetical protein [Aquiflexum gelatinilyticum]|uniref:Uncharacterized protein n=1 Tax=Aquiflexum gelatinilyticum TaxID=2961943 RepID=A0A9X2P678_9BACT|nr:hypothetical protein [Aquiflexum gelatinilyticum]MCR9014262.1 hypothetical protein [Aquiflexum gelatinilyticum]
MNPFPNHSEVLVSALSKKEVEQRLEKVTLDVNFLDYEERLQKGFQFNGKVEKESFRLSLVVNKPDSFLPLILGKIEATPKGCILFLQYRLFPSSAFFLGFWTVVTLTLAVFFGFVTQKPIYAGLSILACIGNYYFAWIYFKRKIKLSKGIFHEILNLKVMD